MSGRGREIRDAVTALLDRAGVRHGPVEFGGKHARMAVFLPDRRHMLTLPVSPGDPRSLRNTVSQTRRLLRSAGIGQGRATT